MISAVVLMAGRVTVIVIYMQEAITSFVIDSPLRFSQLCGMLSHDQIRDELIRQIEARAVKQADIAAALCVAPARITEIKSGTRRIQPHEMSILAERLGMTETNGLSPARIQSTYAIPHLGKVAQGVWLEQSYADPDRPEFVDYDRAPGDPGPEMLFAVTPEGLSMNRLFPPGLKLICRRVPFGVSQVKSGDLVIVEREAHDLREMTCKRFSVDEDGVNWLKSESDQPQFQEPWRIGGPDDGHYVDGEIRIIGKVIRGVLDFSNE